MYKILQFVFAGEAQAYTHLSQHLTYHHVKANWILRVRLRNIVIFK